MPMPLTREHEAVVCGVPTKFILTKYTNRLFVVATQADNLGTLVRMREPAWFALPHRNFLLANASFWPLVIADTRTGRQPARCSE